MAWNTSAYGPLSDKNRAQASFQTDVKMLMCNEVVQTLVNTPHFLKILKGQTSCHGFLHKVYLKVVAVMLTIVLFISTALYFQASAKFNERNSDLDDDIENISEVRQSVKKLEEKVLQLETQLRTKKNIFPDIKFLNYKNRKRILVTGGAGFVGSNLVDKLLQEGHEVVAIDNYYTGRKANVEQWMGHPNFELVHHDVVNPFFIEVDQIYHLASPASPPHYMYNPVKTIKTNTIGTINMLGLARRVKAKILLASTSEVYGDPEVHPQPETYWGHVNPIGPRACYDEGKRVAETLMYAYAKQERVDIRIARIFNTFGPRMHMNDGRVVSNFILQALQNENMTIYGDGKQTRSFQYVSDLVDGLIALMESNVTVPVNLGNPEEHTVEEFANIIKRLTKSKSVLIHTDAQTDDPQQRRPDISRAKELLGWSPKVPMMEGLKLTVDYFRQQLELNRMIGHSYMRAEPQAQSLSFHEKDINTVDQ